MSDRKALLVIPDNSFPFLETVLPIVVEAKRRGVHCETYLIGNRIDAMVSGNPIFRDMFGRSSRLRRFAPGAGMLSKALTFIRLVGRVLALKMRFGDLTVLMRQKKSTGVFDKAFRRLLKAVARPITTKPTQGIFTETYLNRYDPVLGRRFSEEQLRVANTRRPREINPRPLEALFPSDQVTALYTHQEADAIAGRLDTDLPHTVIGLPRLYPGWPDALRDAGKDIIDQELARLGLDKDTKKLLFAPTDPTAAWIRDGQSNERMLAWLLEARKKAWPEARLIIKPKPTFQEHYQQLVQDLGDPMALVSTVPLPAWALAADVAIVASPSVAIFEFLVMNVPTIELADYPDWFGPYRFPWQGTPGLLTAENARELTEAMASIADGSASRPDRTELVRYLGHDDAAFPNLLAAS